MAASNRDGSAGAPRLASDRQIELILRLTEAFERQGSGVLALGRVLDVLKEAIPYRSCSIHIIEPGGGNAYLAASKDLPADLPEPLLHMVQVESLSRADMMPLSERRPYRPLACQGLEEVPSADDYSRLFDGDMVKLPLFSGNRLVGVVTFIHDNGGEEWLAANEPWLRALGRHLGVLIAQVQDFDRLHGQTRNLERQRFGREIADALESHLAEIERASSRLEQAWANGAVERMGEDLAALRSRAAEACAIFHEEVVTLQAQRKSEDIIAQIKDHIASYQRQTGIQCSFTLVDPEGRLALLSGTGGQILEVLQEALLNVHRHGDAEKVEVIADVEGTALRLLVVDDGKGFVVPEVPASKNGLRVMQERAEEMGGRLKVVSVPEEGTIVRLEVPLVSLLGLKGGLR